MKTMYMTTGNMPQIDPVQVVRETATSVVIQSGAAQKEYDRHDDRYHFFSTWDGAKQYLVDRAREDVRYANRLLEMSESRSCGVRALRNKQRLIKGKESR